MKKIIFDVDDTLWSLNKKVCMNLNIPYEKIITFSVYENPLLTKNEKKKMLNAYGNPELFKDILWFDGIKRINQLNDVDIYINSNSVNEECTKCKYKQLTSILKIPSNHILINTIDIKNENVTKKDIDKDAYIFVDDSPHNVSLSNAKYNIMIKTPWNQSASAKQLIKNKNVIFCENLNEVIDVIEHLISEENVKDIS